MRGPGIVAPAPARLSLDRPGASRLALAWPPSAAPAPVLRRP